MGQATKNNSELEMLKLLENKKFYKEVFSFFIFIYLGLIFWKFWPKKVPRKSFGGRGKITFCAKLIFVACRKMFLFFVFVFAFLPKRWFFAIFSKKKIYIFSEILYQNWILRLIFIPQMYTFIHNCYSFIVTALSIFQNFWVDTNLKLIQITLLFFLSSGVAGGFGTGSGQELVMAQEGRC